MRRLIICGLLALSLSALWIEPVWAAEAKFHVNVLRQEDGTTSGEFWYNDKMIWRLTICSDGAEPVSRNGGTGTTLIPDVMNGMFLFKIRNY